eukprot:17031-Heterococcus_DN1.PRE.5
MCFKVAHAPWPHTSREQCCCSCATGSTTTYIQCKATSTSTDTCSCSNSHWVAGTSVFLHTTVEPSAAATRASQSSRVEAAPSPRHATVKASSSSSAASCGDTICALLLTAVYKAAALQPQLHCDTTG